MKNCPICGQPPKDIQREDGDKFYIECTTCGEYFITKEAEMELASNHSYQDKKYILSGVLCEETEHGNRREIFTTNINDILASASIPDGPFEAMDRILLYIKRHLSTVASYVQIANGDYPIAYAKDIQEFEFYLEKLIGLGYLEHSGGEKYWLALSGWKRLAELGRQKIDSTQAFVAMWFSEEMKIAWSDGFEPALTKTGYKPIRIDLIQHNDKIDDRIIAGIRRSGLLVADFTGNRGGVYFESGFAMGLGIPVIWTCRKDCMDSLHENRTWMPRPLGGEEKFFCRRQKGDIM